MNLSSLITDSRGKKSRTWPLVVVAFAVSTVKFALAGLTLPWVGHMPQMGGGEYSAAIIAILGGWWAREHTEKANAGTSD